MVLSNGFFYERIQLDTINERFNKVPTAKEGDANGRGMIVVLTENGIVKNTTGVSLLFKWEHTRIAGAQGLEDFEPLDLTKGEYIVTYPTEMNHEGYVKAEIRIIENGKYAGSRNMKIQVEPSVGDDTAMESSNQFSALVTALLQVNSWNTTIDGKIVEWEDDMTATKQLYIDKMNEVDATLSQNLLSIKSELAEAENQFKLGVYNLKHLKKIKGKRKFTINVLGDSIAAGTAAGSNFGFMQQLENALNVVQQKINYKYNSFYYFNNGWTATETGINKHLLASLDTSSALQITTVTAEIPTISYKVEIIYSTRSDGGNFEVRESVTNTLLATVNCNGVSADGLKTAELTVSASNSVKIVPLTGNKAYVNGWIMKRYPSEASYKIHQLSQGGRKAKGFTDTDLINSVKFETPDLLIWELVANDFSGGDLVAYKQKTELAITTAQSIGADVLLMATLGNSLSETTGYRADWVAWLKATADSFGCAFIDYDEIFGGYTSAMANGLLADAIHPTDLGHLLMANELVGVILNIENPYNRSVIVDLSDNRKPYNNYLLEPKNFHAVGDNYFEKAYFKTTDNNGNAVFANVSPARFLTNASQLPKYAPKGAIANVNDLLYINWVDWGVSQNTQATWGAAYAIGLMETLITTPAANDKNLGKLFRLELSGKDDQIVTYIKTAAGGRKWVKLTPTDTIEWT